MSSLRTGSRLSHGGAQYVLATDPGQVTYRTVAATGLSPKIFTDSQNTNTSGALTFGLPVGYFTAINFVESQVVRDTNNPALGAFAMVRSYTTSSVTVQVFESKLSGVLLGGTVEGLELGTTAMQINLLVIGV